MKEKRERGGPGSVDCEGVGVLGREPAEREQRKGASDAAFAFARDHWLRVLPFCSRDDRVQLCRLARGVVCNFGFYSTVTTLLPRGAKVCV